MKKMIALAALLCVYGATAPAQTPDPVATFSILGFDPATGEIGGAVQSRVFSVGNGVLWGEAGVFQRPANRRIGSARSHQMREAVE